MWHTFGLLFALGTRFFAKRGWYAEKRYVTLRYQILLVNQILMVRGIFPWSFCVRRGCLLSIVKATYTQTKVKHHLTNWNIFDNKSFVQFHKHLDLLTFTPVCVELSVTIKTYIAIFVVNSQTFKYTYPHFWTSGITQVSQGSQYSKNMISYR